MVTLIKEIGSDGLFALLRALAGRVARAGPGVLRALPHQRPRRRRGPDRRQGRPLAATAPAARPRHVRARGRPQRRRHRRPGGQVPHVDQRQRRRDHRLPHPGDERRRRRLRGGVRRAHQRPRPVDVHLVVLVGRPRRVGLPAVVEAQDARDAHRLRRRVRAVGTGLRLPGAAAGRAARAHLRRVPPLHRRLLQAAAGRPAGRRRGRHRRDERGGSRPATSARSSPSWSSTPRPSGRSPTWPRSGPASTSDRHRLPRSDDHQPGQVHLRHPLPPGPRAGAGLRRRAARDRSRRRRLGVRRDPPGAREVLRRRGAGRRAAGR